MLLTVFLSFFFITCQAFADEQLFGYTYGAETMPKGTAQIYQWFTEREGNIAPGNYSAQDYTTELEYGLTNSLQVALYLNAEGRQISGYANGAADDAAAAARVDSFGNDRNDKFKLSGLQASLKYNVLSPYKDSGWGLSFYIEPGYSMRSRISGEEQRQYSIETRMILQKNFLEDRLVWNFNLANEIEKAQLSETGDGMQTGKFDDDEMRFVMYSGLSYLVKSRWYVGMEGRYIFECDNTHAASKFLTFDNYNNCPEHQIFSVGPNIHYTTHKWWITATWLPQLWGTPNTGNNFFGGNQYLIERQRNEFRLKIAYNF